jgi:hypothetical protein
MLKNTVTKYPVKFLFHDTLDQLANGAQLQKFV